MSEENVQIVRSVFAAWAKGDFSSVAAFDPNVSVVWVDPLLTTRAETVGIDETARNMRDFLDVYDHLTATAERVIDAGDRVAAVVEWRGRGKGSGVEFGERQGSVWALIDGRVTHVDWYRDPAEALETAGLQK